MTSGGSDRIRLEAPRILKAPPRCRFSHLKKSCFPASVDALCEVRTGVRRASEVIRCAASRTVSGVTADLSGSFEFKITLARPAHAVLIFLVECGEACPVIAADKKCQERNGEKVGSLDGEHNHA